MDREWIDINGRKLFWREFIIILDDYRYGRIILEKGETVCVEYNRMICVLQEMADNYHQGRDYITGEFKKYFEKHHMKMPMERKLPEALDELFEQLQSNLNVNLTELLDECLRKTEKMYRYMQEEKQREKERRDLVRSLIEENRIVEVEEIEDKYNYFLKHKYNIEKDYEWYAEDFLGCELDEPTDLKIEDNFSLCDVRVKEALGVSK